MSVCIALRDDYDSIQLRRLAKRCRDPRQVRRLLALAAAYDGMSRAEAAKVGGMDRQTLRDWAHRFNEEGPEGLKHRAGAGRPRLLSDEQMGELSVIVETGPDPEVDGVVRWRRIDLKRVIEERFGVTYSERGISDLLAALSFSHISARPQHPRQDERVIEAFKKLPLHAGGPHSRSSQGHAGRNLVPRRGPIGTEERPCANLGEEGYPATPARRSALHQRLPVRRHLPQVGQGRRSHAPLRQHPRYADASRRDQLQRRCQGPRRRPDGPRRLAQHRQAQGSKKPHHHPAASRSPELNPVENIWQYLRQNWLSNRVFEDYHAIIEAGCQAWNKLIAQPETIMSIGLRDWAHTGR